jgi:hypothetical protein
MEGKMAEEFYFDNLFTAEKYLLENMIDQTDVDNLFQTYHYNDPYLNADYKNKIVKQQLYTIKNDIE